MWVWWHVALGVQDSEVKHVMTHLLVTSHRRLLQLIFLRLVFFVFADGLGVRIERLPFFLGNLSIDWLDYSARTGHGL